MAVRGFHGEISGSSRSSRFDQRITCLNCPRDYLCNEISYNMTIRLATSEDPESVSTLLREAFQAFKHLYTPGAFEATCISTEEATRRIQEGPVWLAEYEQKVVGTMS